MSTFRISAADNATPIQITTSGSHGFVNGQTVFIFNCSSNMDANGTWIAGNSTSNTFTLTSSVGSQNITGASNANPIVITVASHKYVTGNSVFISGVGGNTAANGTRTITVIDGTSFSLDGISGNGTYTSGGTCGGNYAGSGIAYSDSIAVTNASNTSPIIITTGANNNLMSGQTVTISGVSGNTAANGTFSIVTNSNNQFSLYSTSSSLTTGRSAISGNGAYTSGGFIASNSDYSLINVFNNNSVDGYYFNSNFGGLVLINDVTALDGYKYSGNSSNFGETLLQNFANVLDVSKYFGNQANFGDISLDEKDEFGDIDYDATSIYPKTKTTYYKLRGYNPNTQTFETWITQEKIVTRPELYTPGTNPPNYFNGIFYTPPSGNVLRDIVIIGKWVQ